MSKSQCDQAEPESGNTDVHTREGYKASDSPQQHMGSKNWRERPCPTDSSLRCWVFFCMFVLKYCTFRMSYLSQARPAGPTSAPCSMRRGYIMLRTARAWLVEGAPSSSFRKDGVALQSNLPTVWGTHPVTSRWITKYCLGRCWPDTMPAHGSLGHRQQHG